jgi:hypothetical protein
LASSCTESIAGQSATFRPARRLTDIDILVWGKSNGVPCERLRKRDSVDS